MKHLRKPGSSFKPNPAKLGQFHDTAYCGATGPNMDVSANKNTCKDCVREVMKELTLKLEEMKKLLVI